MIAPGEAGSDARRNPTPDIGPLDSSRGGLLAHGEADKARTLRTKHGPLGCRAGNALRGGRFRRVCFVKAIAFWLAQQRLTSPFSRAVRALSALSALCPFLTERRDQPPVAVAAMKYFGAIQE